jgi:hypothetical protein
MHSSTKFPPTQQKSHEKAQTLLPSAYIVSTCVGGEGGALEAGNFKPVLGNISGIMDSLSQKSQKKLI